MSEPWDHSADVLIVGGGAAGLGAALTAKAQGLEPIVLEGGQFIGGSTNALRRRHVGSREPLLQGGGQDDSPEKVLEYLEALVGDVPPASTRARKEAFVYNVPRAFEFLEGQGLKFRWASDFPDYYPHYPGGSDGGRGIDPELFDRGKLGELRSGIRRGSFRTLAWGAAGPRDASCRAKRSLKGAAVRGGSVRAALPAASCAAEARRRRRAHCRRSFSIRCLQRNIPFWIDTKAIELVDRERPRRRGRRRAGRASRVRIEGRRAVFLGAGGFARNEEMRQQYQRHPITNEWTSRRMSDQGDGIKLGISVGAATALMDEAWWGPSSMLPDRDGPAIFHVSGALEAGLADRRPVRAAATSTSRWTTCWAGQTMYERNAAGARDPVVPDLRPAPTAPAIRSARSSGRRRRSSTAGTSSAPTRSRELAKLCDLDPQTPEADGRALQRVRASGIDEDFHRGENAYDRYFGDPRVKPNPNLGAIDKRAVLRRRALPRRPRHEGRARHRRARAACCARTARRSRASTPRATRPRR